MTRHRRGTLAFALTLAFSQIAAAQDAQLSSILAKADGLEPLETVIVAQRGDVLAERGYDGHSVTEATNIKSASKTVISALVGIAIDRGFLEGVDQPVADILGDALPDSPDPRLATVTIGNLLSMQAGLEPTSGGNYGRWVSSRDWVRYALSQPFADEPGGRMLYSTGSTHLLSAVLTEATGRSTLANARDWLAPAENFSISSWAQDPQGIYLGGNEMAMTPRSLLAFGEIYRTGGLSNGERILSEDWIEKSWTEHTNSRYSGDGYGYGWFLRQIGGQDVHYAYAYGYGGQMLYIVPGLDLTVVMTSDDNAPSARTGHRDDLHALLLNIIDAVEEQEG